MDNTHYRHVATISLVLMLLLLMASCGTPPTPVPPALPSDTPSSVATTAATPTAVETVAAAQKQTVTPVVPVPTAVVPTPAAPINTPTLAVAAAALVNDQPIPLEEYEAQVALAITSLSQQQSFDPSTEEGKAALLQLRRQLLDALIDQALIEQAAAREGISISEQQAEAEMTRLIGDDVAKFEEWLKANGLTRDSFKAQLQRQLLSAAFQEHMIGSLPSVVEQVHARHILVMSEAEAMDILIKLRSGESFAALAKQYSQDKGSNDLGGDLGFFPRAVMPLEIEAVAFALAPGQTSGIVRTDYGYHIVEVVEKDPARKVPDEMLVAWQQQNFLQWLKGQRAAARIKYLIPME